MRLEVEKSEFWFATTSNGFESIGGLSYAHLTAYNSARPGLRLLHSIHHLNRYLDTSTPKATLNMGTKRQIDEVDSQTANGGHAASGKRHKSYAGRKRPAQEDSGAKKRIRAIERSLRRNQDMPANVRIELERELASQKQILEEKQYRRKRSAMISKYHHVRFFGACEKTCRLRASSSSSSGS